MRLLTILFVLCLPFLAASQSARVTGTITDKKTGDIIPGATIINQDQVGASSSIEGKYSIELPAGEHELTYSFIGYADQKRTITLTSGETKVIDISLSEESIEVGIVVVSAGKFEQDLGEVTVSMEVLKPSVIENRNTTNLDEVLQQTPGVSIVDNEPQIRSGSGYSFGAGSRVMVLLDDLPILSGDAGRPSWGFLPIENVEQVEVIKGASSVLYGSAALSGVINLRTAYPKGEPQTKFTAFYGFYSDPQTEDAKYWDGSLMKSGLQFLHSRQIGQFDLVVGGNFLADDGYLGPIISRDSLGNAIDTASSAYNPFNVDRFAGETRGRLNINTRYRSKKHPGLSMGINANWLKGESLATLVWENADSGLYQAYQGSATRTKQVIGTVDPFIEYYTPKGSSHKLRMRWQNLDNDNDNNQGNFSDVYFGQYTFQQNFDRFGIRNMKVTTGLMGQRTYGESQLYRGDNEDGINEAANYAGFLQVDKTFLDRLTVSAGIRYEYFEINKDSDAKPVFRTGVNYQMGIASYIRASFGQGFRFPSIAEKFIQTAVGSLVIYPNEDLVAETSYNAEVGFKQGFKIGEFKGFADIALFTQEYENFIEFTFGQWSASQGLDNLFGFGFRSLNTGRSQVQGAEFSILGTGSIGPYEFDLLAGYTYTLPITLNPDLAYADGNFSEDIDLPVTYLSTSSDTTNNILKYRMQHLIRGDVEVRRDKWMLGLSYRFNTPIQNIDVAFIDVTTFDPSIDWGLADWMENRNNPVHIFDLRLGYTFSEGQRISLVVWNLTNEEYAIRPLAVEAPRLTTLQYTLSF
ncbi:TonB-dependent receptor [Sanyastnella coralliicola]|uniref:TonB-dependent receptor n=1 Tax=Sanyastnella coralliicola TaxID=3069118 RepID=UPI0027B8D75F|nr:TonB-dependent receptor [Longitalea sp. SCSIO 12813]